MAKPINLKEALEPRLRSDLLLDEDLEELARLGAIPAVVPADAVQTPASSIEVSPSQIEERNAWDLRLKLGHITLADTVVLCMLSGAPASAYLLGRVEAAFNAYLDTGASAELAGALFDFGGKGSLSGGGSGAPAMSGTVTVSEKNRRQRETLRNSVRFHVNSFHEQGHSKSDPKAYEGTAFHLAAELLGMKVGTVFDLYTGHR